MFCSNSLTVGLLCAAHLPLATKKFLERVLTDMPTPEVLHSRNSEQIANKAKKGFSWIIMTIFNSYVGMTCLTYW